MLILGAIAVAILFVVGGVLIALGRRFGPGEIDPTNSDAAREWNEMREHQENIARRWSGFLP